jgi:hypothetical protein
MQNTLRNYVMEISHLISTANGVRKLNEAPSAHYRTASIKNSGPDEVVIELSDGGAANQISLTSEAASELLLGLHALRMQGGLSPQLVARDVPNRRGSLEVL